MSLQQTGLAVMEQDDFEFDIRQSVKRRNVLRLVVASLFSLGLIWFGTWLVPDETILEVSVDAIESWNGWSFVALDAVLSVVWGLLKELVFAVRSYST